MAEISKAQKRQSVGNKGLYQAQFARSIRNKVKRLRSRVAHHPHDKVAKSRLDYWTSGDGLRRKHTKWAG